MKPRLPAAVGLLSTVHAAEPLMFWYDQVTDLPLAKGEESRLLPSLEPQ